MVMQLDTSVADLVFPTVPHLVSTFDSEMSIFLISGQDSTFGTTKRIHDYDELSSQVPTHKSEWTISKQQ
jgi:hypothetical protein